MAQHFLKSAGLRDFTLADVAFMSEDACFEKFIELRWKNRNQAVCPHCGVVDRHYYRKTRRQWRCKDCDGYFSITTRTPFQDHKICFKLILIGIMEYVSSPNGISLHALSAKMNVQV